MIELPNECSVRQANYPFATIKEYFAFLLNMIEKTRIDSG